MKYLMQFNRNGEDKGGPEEAVSPIEKWRGVWLGVARDEEEVSQLSISHPQIFKGIIT